MDPLEPVSSLGRRNSNAHRRDCGVLITVYGHCRRKRNLRDALIRALASVLLKCIRVQVARRSIGNRLIPRRGLRVSTTFLEPSGHGQAPWAVSIEIQVKTRLVGAAVIKRNASQSPSYLCVGWSILDDRTEIEGARSCLQRRGGG